MRRGHWIILDELNLAPTDVLEALNRLLDENRELFIPETQETVTAHRRFILFATQNPPGLYGGIALIVCGTLKVKLRVLLTMKILLCAYCICFISVKAET